jgi:hypothetical protein
MRREDRADLTQEVEGCASACVVASMRREDRAHLTQEVEGCPKERQRSGSWGGLVDLEVSGGRGG